MENTDSTVPHFDQDMGTKTDGALESCMKLIMGHFGNHISSSIITLRICFPFCSIDSDQPNTLAQQLMNLLVQKHDFLTKLPVDASVLSTADVFVCVRDERSVLSLISISFSAICSASGQDLTHLPALLTADAQHFHTAARCYTSPFNFP